MKSILVSIVAAVVLVACASKPEYSGSYSLTLVEGMTIRFQLKSDGSFIGSPEGEDFATDALVGTWKIEGDLLVCEGTTTEDSEQITVKFDKTTFKLISYAGNGEEAPLDEMIPEGENGIYLRKSQQSTPAPETKPEPPTAEAPDISIHEAVMLENVEVVKQHLAAGTDVNEYTDGWTPLHQAAYQGYGDIVELLLSEGADVHAPLKHELVAGKTAVDIAIISKHLEVADLLQKFGGNSSAKVSIFHAVELGDVEATKKHLADGVGVDIKDEHGRTPLCLAVSSRDKETVQLLIDKGADVNFKMDVFGGTRTLLDIVIMESADMPTLPPDTFTMGSPGMPTLPDDFTSRGEPGDGMPSEAEVEQYMAKLWAEMYSTDKLKEIADLLRKHGGKTGDEL